MSVTATENMCLWPVDETCLGTEWDDYPEPVQTLALGYASATMERLTGYRVGVCPIKLRPDLSGVNLGCLDPLSPGGGWFGPMNWAGQWSNRACGTPDNREIALPPPVGRIDEVKVDGAVIDPSDYVLQNGSILVWRGTGEAPWTTNDMLAPDTEPGTMSVTYLNAVPVDAQGANAVTRLALEFALACAGEDCQLPANVTLLVRQGVTMQIAAGTFPGGVTGLRQVDAYIALHNPNHLSAPMTIYSGNMPAHRVEQS